MSDDKSIALDLITLKKSTYLNKLKEAVPKVKGSIPNFGLPKWKHLPLESKIPMIPGLQENMYTFTRSKLGESLRIRFNGFQPFDMSDPYNNEIQLPYEGMHDAHLAHYFRTSPHVQDALIKMGLITPQLDVKCSLKEYNNYRNYLRVMHGKLIRNVLEKRDKILREKKLLNYAENQTLKKIERLKKDEIRENLLKELKLKETNKLKEILRKDKENDQRVETINEMRYQISQRKKMESKKKRDYIINQRAIMAKKEEQKILNTLNKWHERDCLLRKTKEQNLLKIHNNKKALQEEQIEKELLVKEYAEKIKKSFLNKYQRKLEENKKKSLLLLKKDDPYTL
ncbi:PREDICTED: fibrous sheath-interacting protein 2-like [Ceratosolen solmsi marchali]|uniref:Fibrous sheath-interacting protein 2-like n=1 Tax=Ceratosolen solmsi marchali TaxID=326594 RepID=A0AAJ7E0A3_9HYME|nr:PREDICTED: fibrous sheath-interacting protein 2-like [Ceratosolen solmsi marchali]